MSYMRVGNMGSVLENAAMEAQRFCSRGLGFVSPRACCKSMLSTLDAWNPLTKLRGEHINKMLEVVGEKHLCNDKLVPVTPREHAVLVTKIMLLKVLFANGRDGIIRELRNQLQQPEIDGDKINKVCHKLAHSKDGEARNLIIQSLNQLGVEPEGGWDKLAAKCADFELTEYARTQAFGYERRHPVLPEGFFNPLWIQ